MTTANNTDKQLESLRIEPERKLPRRGGNKRAIVLLFVGVAVGIVIANAIPRAEVEAPAKPADGAATPAADAVKPEPKTGDVILTATGYVTPRHRASLSPQVIGQVVWVGIEKGDSVKQGQELIRLDDRDYQATVRQREAELLSAKARLARLESGPRKEEIDRAEAEVRQVEAELSQASKTLERTRDAVANQVETRQRLDDAEGVFAATEARLGVGKAQLAELKAGYRKEDIDEARANVANVQASLEYAHLQLEDTLIKAPSDGTILEKLIEVGELVSPQSFGGTRGARTELLSLANLAELQVEVDISEADFDKIRSGNPAKVFLDAYPAKSYNGHIREIAPEADRQKATIQVKVAIDDPDALVRPEMSARVDFLKP